MSKPNSMDSARKAFKKALDDRGDLSARQIEKCMNELRRQPVNSILAADPVILAKQIVDNLSEAYHVGHYGGRPRRLG